MAQNSHLRNKFAHLIKPRGPRPGWQARAAAELGLSRSYINNLKAGRATSPAALAALADWKQQNKIA